MCHHCFDYCATDCDRSRDTIKNSLGKAVRTSQDRSVFAGNASVSARNPKKITIVPNLKKGVSKRVLDSCIGKEIKVRGKLISREIGSSIPNCKIGVQSECLRKIKVMLLESSDW